MKMEGGKGTWSCRWRGRERHQVDVDSGTWLGLRGVLQVCHPEGIVQLLLKSKKVFLGWDLKWT